MEVPAELRRKVAPERRTERKQVGSDGFARRYTGADAARIGQSAGMFPNAGGNTVYDRPGRHMPFGAFCLYRRVPPHKILTRRASARKEVGP